jgi:hypothetical protein
MTWEKPIPFLRLNRPHCLQRSFQTVGAFFVSINPFSHYKEVPMEFFTTAVSSLSTVVTAIGAGVGVWGIINLMEGYGGDNPASKSQGVKQLMAGGGVILLGLKVVPLLSGLFS